MTVQVRGSEGVREYSKGAAPIPCGASQQLRSNRAYN
jgi:hypothetical protein